MLKVLFLFLSFAAHAEEGTAGSLLAAPNKTERLDKEDQSVLERHYPFYYVYGRPLSKLQVSFKSPIVRGFPLYFGYTQFMFWELGKESKPFRDFTYNPELFYRLEVKKMGFLKSVDFGLFGHNSNGKSRADSRSLDKHYVRLNFDKEGDRWVTRFGAQVSYLYEFDETNRDIQDFIGPLSLSVSFIQLFNSWVDKSEVALSVSPGGKFSHRWDQGGYQLSWSFRFGKFDLTPAFYMQYYYGYAETLLNYNQEVSEFRGGIIF